MLMTHNSTLHSVSPIDKDDSARAKLNMEKCIKTIKDFLLENNMKLNDGKTEFLLMGTSNGLKKEILMT